MLASLFINMHSFKTSYYKHEHTMAPKSVHLKLPVTLNPRKCSEVCVSSRMCVAVMRVLCRASSPLCELYSMTANFSEAEESCPKVSFYHY